jgi:hypothetical protein
VRPVEHYDATPGVYLGAASIVGGIFTAIPATIMGVRGRKVAREGGTATNAGWALGLGIAGIVWAAIGTLFWVVIIGSTGAALVELDSQLTDMPGVEQDLAEAVQFFDDPVCSSIDDLPVDPFARAGALSGAGTWGITDASPADLRQAFVDFEAASDSIDVDDYVAGNEDQLQSAANANFEAAIAPHCGA